MNMDGSINAKIEEPMQLVFGDDDDDADDGDWVTVMLLQSLLVVAGGAAVSGLSPGYGAPEVSCDWSAQGHVTR